MLDRKSEDIKGFAVYSIHYIICHPLGGYFFNVEVHFFNTQYSIGPVK
jgi:hypothetical protein